jgi:hypothetical protein
MRRFASVSVQNIVTGTAGHVEITTVKDGVQTTETHDFPVTGNGTTVIMTPAPNPEPPNDDRRPPREDRGSVAVQTVSVSKTNGNTVTTHTSLTTASTDRRDIKKYNFRSARLEVRN